VSIRSNHRAPEALISGDGSVRFFVSQRLLGGLLLQKLLAVQEYLVIYGTLLDQQTL